MSYRPRGRGYRGSGGGYNNNRNEQHSSSFSTNRGRGRYFSSHEPHRGSRRGARRGSSFRGGWQPREDSRSFSSYHQSRLSDDKYGSSRSGRDDGNYRKPREYESPSSYRSSEHRRVEFDEPPRKRTRQDTKPFSPQASMTHRTDSSYRGSSEHQSRSYVSSSYASESSAYRGSSRSSHKPREDTYTDYKERSSSPFHNRRVSVRGSLKVTTRNRGARGRTSRFVGRRGTSIRARRVASSRYSLPSIQKTKQMRYAILRARNENREAFRMKKLNLGSKALKKRANDEDEIDDEEQDNIKVNVKREKKGSSEGNGEERSVRKVSEKKMEIKQDKLEDSSERDKEMKLESSDVSDIDEAVSDIPKHFIKLKCVHCKTVCRTFRQYEIHLKTMKHKAVMARVIRVVRRKLYALRVEQRNEQRLLDNGEVDTSQSSFCRLCKLNFRQPRYEHYVSEFHIKMNEFLNPTCSVCRISFASPMLFEVHKCQISHIKRKAYLEKQGVKVEENETEAVEEADPDGNFMVLDSVGSGDEEVNVDDEKEVEEEDEEETKEVVLESEEKTPTTVKKNNVEKVYNDKDFLSKVEIYYCKLCDMTMPYKRTKDQESIVRAHCRSRMHLVRFKTYTAKKKKCQTAKNTETTKDTDVDKSTDTDGERAVIKESSSVAKAEIKDEYKLSDDDESKSSIRFDRFRQTENDRATKGSEDVADDKLTDCLEEGDEIQ